MPNSKKVLDPENWGPEAMLRVLEEGGRGDGPLARSLRQHIADPRPGPIVISSTMRGTFEDEIQELRSAIRRIESDMLIAEELLTKAIADGFSEPLHPEILNRMGDVLRECRLQRLSSG